jgi:hypothetical protein
MPLVSRLLWVVLTVFVVGACNQVEETSKASLTVVVSEDPIPGGVLLEGVQVCEAGTDNCVMTEANGEATLMVPVDQEISYTLTKEGYASWLRADVVPADGLTYRLGMWTEQTATNQHEGVGASYPMRGTGSIWMQVVPNAIGATFDLVDATGEPFYAAPGGGWVPLYTATTTWGWGGFTEVTPGEYQVEVGGEVEKCVPNEAWPGNDQKRIRIPVREGYITLASASCAIAPPDGSALIQVYDGPENPRLPLEGAEVCETDTTNCAMTDAGGLARLQLPVNQEVSFTITKEGYEPILKVDETDLRFESMGITLWKDELVVPWYESVMSAYPPTRVGTVWVGLTPPLMGATFELIDAKGEPFYDQDDSTQASRDLKATTSAGSGGFLEVPPGEFQIALGGTASGCKAWRAWPGDAENRIRFLVRDGYLTALNIDCRDVQP